MQTEQTKLPQCPCKWCTYLCMTGDPYGDFHWYAGRGHACLDHCAKCGAHLNTDGTCGPSYAELEKKRDHILRATRRIAKTLVYYIKRETSSRGQLLYDKGPDGIIEQALAEEADLDGR